MVVDKDLGWKAICRNANKLHGRTIKAGVLEGAGSYSKGQSIAQVAMWNEYGTRKIPSRPFIAIATDEHNGWEGETKVNVASILSPHGDVNKSLDRIGEQMKIDVRNVIGDRGKLAENAPATIARKGHNFPLIDTGELKKTISYEVK